MQTVMVEPPTLGKIELIRQAQKGNQSAFGELYQQHVDAIYRYIHKRVNVACEAEDLTQIVFLKAWHALCDYQPTVAPFRAWLYRIAHNAVIDHYRTQRTLVDWAELVTVVDGAPLPEIVVLTEERQAAVHHAIATLRPAYREVIIHRFLRNLDYAETAAALGHQVNNVRVLQHRALDALRRALAQEGALWLAMVATAVTLLLGTQLVYAAETALPGDSLYPMRTVAEAAAVYFSDDLTAIHLHTAFADQRIAELQALARQGRLVDMRAAVANYSTQIVAASTKLMTATQNASLTNEPLRAQVVQTLAHQSAALTRLATGPAALQLTIEPALVTLTAAQQTLVDAESEVPLPVPTPLPTTSLRAEKPAPPPLLQPTATAAAAPAVPSKGTMLPADAGVDPPPLPVLASPTPITSTVPPDPQAETTSRQPEQPARAAKSEQTADPINHSAQPNDRVTAVAIDPAPATDPLVDQRLPEQMAPSPTVTPPAADTGAPNRAAEGTNPQPQQAQRLSAAPSSPASAHNDLPANQMADAAPDRERQSR